MNTSQNILWKAKMEICHLSAQYSVRKLEPDDLERIYALSRENKTFYQYHPPFVTRESILEDMEALPPGKNYDDKFYLGFFDGDTLAAVMDLILDYPRETVAFIGLFMMNRDLQGRGIGTGIIQDCAAYLASLGYRSIQLGIDKGNPQSEAFWRKNGFHFTGREIPNEFSSYLYMEHFLSVPSTPSGGFDEGSDLQPA